MSHSLIYTFMFWIIANFAFAGGVNVGSGGDWRRTLLNNAKRGASYWSNSVALNLPIIENDPLILKEDRVYKFLTKPGLLTLLATDIINSIHIYNPDIGEVHGEYTSCAWTNDPSLSKMTDIVFSLKLCEGGLELGGQNYANRLLIHESIHHLLLSQALRIEIGAVFTGDLNSQKQQEDVFCDEIAEVIEKYNDVISSLEKNHWEDIALPFSSDQSNTILASRGFHSSAWTGETNNENTSSKLIVWGGCNEGSGGILGCGPEGYLGDGGIYDSKKNLWTLMSRINSPSPRSEAASVWTGDLNKNFKSKFIVWGGCVDGDGCERKLGDGAIYDLEKDQWEAIGISEKAPAPRVYHSMIWTGKQIIIWGGNPQDVAPIIAKPLNNGSIYDLESKTWEKLPNPIFEDGSTFVARGHHHGLWLHDIKNDSLNNKMLVWGGCSIEVSDRCPMSFNDGALYDPKTKSWSRLITSGITPKSRHGESFTYVPSQQKVYLFGGFDSRGNILSDGAVLDLINLTWTPMASSSLGRAQHTSVWANGQLILFGGIKNEYSGIKEYEDRVLSYSPKLINDKENGVWNIVKTDELVPLKTIHHTAVWTGDSMLVWGGQTSEQQFINLGAKLFFGLEAR